MGVPGRGSSDYLEQFVMPMLTAFVPATINLINPVADAFVNQIDPHGHRPKTEKGCAAWYYRDSGVVSVCGAVVYLFGSSGGRVGRSSSYFPL